MGSQSKKGPDVSRPFARFLRALLGDPVDDVALAHG